MSVAFTQQERAVGDWLVRGRRILWRNYAAATAIAKQDNNNAPLAQAKDKGSEYLKEDQENVHPGPSGQNGNGNGNGNGKGDFVVGKWKLPGHKIFERLVVRLGKKSEALQVRNVGGGDVDDLETSSMSVNGRPCASESLVVGSIFEEFVLYEIFGQSRKNGGPNKNFGLRAGNGPATKRNNQDVVGSVEELGSHKSFLNDLSQEGWRLEFAVVVQVGGDVSEAGVDVLLDSLYSDTKTLEKICVLAQCHQPTPKGLAPVRRTFTFCSEGLSLDFLKWNEPLSNTCIENGQGKATEIRFRFKRSVLEKLHEFGRAYKLDVEYFGVLVYALTLHMYSKSDEVTICTSSGTLVVLNFTNECNIGDLIGQMRRQLELGHGSKSGLANGHRSAFGGMGAEGGELIVEQQLRQNVLKYCIRFQRGVLHEVLVNQFVDSFKKLFGEVLEDTFSGRQLPLSSYSALRQDQLYQILHDWNATQRPDYALNVNVVDMFEKSALEQPDALALTFGETKWTYAELNQRSNQVAHHLRRVYDIGRRGHTEIVAVSMERSAELVAAILGVLKAGGAYVPIDPNYPLERVQYMLQDSEAKVVITQSHLVDRLGLNGSEGVLTLEKPTEDRSSGWGLRAECAENLFRADDWSERVAYIIYTSGSTGRPKGVMIRHRNLSNYLYWCREQYVDRGYGGQVALYSSISFDLTVTSIFAPLVCGMSLFVAAPSGSFDHTLDQLQGNQFGFLKLTPSHLDLLTAHRQQMGQMESPLTNTFIVGGENLNFSQVVSLVNGRGCTRIINEYGPTETTVGCTTYTVDQTPDQCVGSIPIGRPIANTQMYVLDKDLQPVPVGCIGELYIGGAGVGLGYWKRPELTDEKFVPNPFMTNENTRDKLMYRTGDLGRWTPDGNLVFLGRIDDQVKIRGFRVELPEIESALDQFNNVRQCAVCVEEQTLVAYLILQEPGLGIEIGTLRAYLSSRLPAHMVPASFVIVSSGMSFPLSPGGKIDKKRLTNLKLARVDESAVFVGGRNELEVTVCDMWARILKLNRVGIDDDFFRLGGDSIKCMQFVGQLNELLRLQTAKLNSGHIYTYPTIRRLLDNFNQQNAPGEVERTSFWTNMMADLMGMNRIEDISNSDDCFVAETTVEFTLPQNAHGAYATKDEDLLLSAYAGCLTRMTNKRVHHVAVRMNDSKQKSFPLRLEMVDGDLANSLKNVKEIRAWAERELKQNVSSPTNLDLSLLPTILFGQSSTQRCGIADSLAITIDDCIDGSGASLVHVHLCSRMESKYLEVLRENLMSALEEIVAHCKDALKCFLTQTIRYTMSDFADEFDPFIVYNEPGRDVMFMFPPALGGAESYLGNVCQGLATGGDAEMSKKLVLLNNWYLYLARRFGEEYASQATLEMVAAEYIRLMRRVQSRGPYQLFGWSFGGLMAQEVARQLVVLHGDSVARLVMVDPLFNFRAAAHATGVNVGLCKMQYHLNYAYAPAPWTPPPGMDVVLFKANVGVCGARDLEWMDAEYRQFYDTFNFDAIYAYYSSRTANNHLDSILTVDSFRTVDLGTCNHFSWLEDEKQMAAVCRELQ